MAEPRNLPPVVCRGPCCTPASHPSGLKYLQEHCINPSLHRDVREPNQGIIPLMDKMVSPRTLEKYCIILKQALDPELWRENHRAAFSLVVFCWMTKWEEPSLIHKVHLYLLRPGLVLLSWQPGEAAVTAEESAQQSLW